MRELAGIRAGYEQDIPAYVNIIAARKGQTQRHLSQLEALELHSNIPDKTNISSILERLEKESMDAVFATSMFGTGVDIDRLSQMIVHGQPKTTSNYIQATGRVGRKKGALVVTFLRSTRSRDLDHYEFFTGYHRALHRHVEPLTVFPFSPGAVNKGLLPVMVAILRDGITINNVPINKDWAAEDQYKAETSGSRRMATHRPSSKEIDEILKAVKKRNNSQPEDRVQPDQDVTGKLNSLVSSWEIKAKKITDLYYYENAFGRIPKKHVVLGDEKHKQAGLSSVNENTPNSLRDVESGMRFRD
jgi:superfamily II DNA/RNA helicase